MKNYIDNRGFVSVASVTNSLQITGSVFISGSVVVNNGTVKKASGPKAVVGNSVEGDTLNDCDYLDSGNGVALQEAIAYVNSFTRKGTVAVRPGTYTLTGTVNVPSFVSLVGQGTGYDVIFAGTATNRKLLVFQAGAMGTDFGLDLPSAPTTGATGTEIVEIIGTARVARVSYNLPALNAAQALTESLRYGFKVGNFNSNAFQDLNLTIGYSRTALGVTGTFTHIQNRGSDVGAGYINNCSTFGGDIGLECNGNVIVSDCNIQRPVLTGILGQSIAGATGGPVIVGGNIRMVPSTAILYGVRFDTGGNAAGMRNARIVGTKIVQTGTSLTGSAGVAFTGTGIGALADVSVDNFYFGVTVSSTQTRSQFKGVIASCNIALGDASGQCVTSSVVY